MVYCQGGRRNSGGGGGTGKSIIYNYTLYFHKVHTQIPTQSRQRLNSHLLLNGIYGGMCCNYTLYFHKVHTQIPTQSRQRLNSHLLLNGIYGGMCCKVDFANKLAIFTVILKDNRHVAIEQIFMLILKNYFVLLYAA